MPAHGTPIAAAITPLPTWRDIRVSGITAPNDSTAKIPRAINQALGETDRDRPSATATADGSALGSVSLTSRPYAWTVPGTIPDSKHQAAHRPPAGVLRRGAADGPAAAQVREIGRERIAPEHDGATRLDYFRRARDRLRNRGPVVSRLGCGRMEGRGSLLVGGHPDRSRTPGQTRRCGPLM